jgi:hypothetical protein
MLSFSPNAISELTNCIVVRVTVNVPNDAGDK